jgi:hypothetical protein
MAEEIAELRRENERLTAEMDTYCAYCGARFPIDKDGANEAVSAHIQHCEKHPMRAVEQERDEARRELEGVKAELAAAKPKEPS